MRIRPLVDEFDAQQHQCAAHNVVLIERDNEADIDHTQWGADPFDVVSQLELELGHPINLS